MTVVINGTTGIDTVQDGIITSAKLASAQTPSFNGIKFPATQVASADANTLDDYEEGTWTPTVTSASGSLTSYNSGGWYVKIGRSVTVSGYITLTNAGTASGTCYLGSFPFPATNQSFPAGNRNAIGICREDAITGYVSHVFIDSGGAYIQKTDGSAISWTTNYAYVWTITYQASS
jgi:hypothetical protein